MKPTMLNLYKETIAPALKEQLGYTNAHQVPQLEKIVISSCMGSEDDRKQAVEDAAEEISNIACQRPVITMSKRSVSNFKLREGEPLGAKVTLRSTNMWNFLEKLIHTAIPKVRDFRGIPPKSFDGTGNYTMGVSDQTIFPEIELDKVKRNIGFDITFVTTAKTDDEARALLTAFGMPFRKIKKESDGDAAAA